jgi:phosphatidate cytidylyltransferase
VIADLAVQPVTRPDEAGRGARRRFGDWGQGLEDLAPRLLTAAVLIPGAIAAALAGGPWLAAACGAAVAAMSYEWARMSEPQGQTAAFLITMASALAAVAAASWQLVGPAMIALGLGAIAAGVRRAGLTGRAEAAFGVVYVGLPPAAFLWLRQDGVGGANLILGLFFVVWAADAAAYFGGRLIGGPKLHPGISPNKTWAGVGAGVLAGAGAGWGCAGIFSADPATWVMAGAALGAVSMAGDLLESLLKRRFGVKDASGFIPGHGGVLDRLDGLMAAALALAGAVLANPAVAVALAGGQG